MEKYGKIISVLLLPLFAMVVSAFEFETQKAISYYPEEVLEKEGAYARKRCLIDVKWPVGVSNFATVVNFHGGGLVNGARSMPPWPKEAYNKDPVAFVAGGYRLITNATPAQAISDAAAVVAWTLKNISRYGGDPKKVFVTGVSAGGYLTAMVGMDGRWLAPYGFKPTDLAGIAPLTGQMTKHFNVRKIGFKDEDAQFLPKIDEWSPLHYASAKSLPPCCFLTGGRDIEWKARVEENELLAASIKACGHRNCEFHETEGNHGGGVYPSCYLLRDFVMKTCDAGGIPRFVDGEYAVLTGGQMIDSFVALYLQLFWSTRYPGSDVKVVAASLEDFRGYRAKRGFNPTRVLAFHEGVDMASERKEWSALGVKQMLRLTSSPVEMSDVLFDLTQTAMASNASPERKRLMTAMQLIATMHVNPYVARVVIDAKKGVAFAPNTSRHKDASGKKLPDCFNVKVPDVDVRADGIAFTYAPKSLPFPMTTDYKVVERHFPLTERLNQEIFMVERLRPGMYELAFDGVKVGEFSSEEFENGVNVALLDTPNQRKASSLVNIAESLHDKCSAWREKHSAASMDEMKDAFEMLNAVRPSVSRVTLKMKKR